MVNINKLFLRQDTTLNEAIKTIDRGAAQIGLVVDNEKRLLGTLTDGDIRRGLMKGFDLKSSVEQVMNRKFFSLPEGVSESKAIRSMRKNELHQIPVMDNKGRVVHLYLMKEYLKTESLPNSVVIMAGGEGQRMRPKTVNCPKPMLKIGNKPMLEIILEQCIEAGFKKFYISVNYLKEQIVLYFQDGSKWGIEIVYIEESQPLGTAGALELLPKKSTNPILVINGDILTRVDLSNLLLFHQQQKAVATICVSEHETEIPYGVIFTKGQQVTQLEEKPVLRNHINAGIYVIEPSIINYLSKDQYCHMTDLILKALNQNEKVVIFPVHEYWMDIGNPESLIKANGDWQ